MAKMHDLISIKNDAVSLAEQKGVVCQPRSSQSKGSAVILAIVAEDGTDQRIAHIAKNDKRPAHQIRRDVFKRLGLEH